MGGISIWQLLIVLVIVLVLFGAKRLRNVGGDLGHAVKGFRGAMKDGEEAAKSDDAPTQNLQKKESGEVIDVEVSKADETKKDSRHS
jgi:sec-independent protein translocase protein TatA